jgi:hypothetical protein
MEGANETEFVARLVLNTIALSLQMLRIWRAFHLTERLSSANCRAVGRSQTHRPRKRVKQLTGFDVERT